MGSFDNLFGTTEKKPKASTFSGLFGPEPQLRAEAQRAEKQAVQASSFTGLFKETVAQPVRTFVEAAKSTFEESAKTQVLPKSSLGELFNNPFAPSKEAIDAAVNAIGTSLIDATKRFVKTGEAITKGESPLELATSVGESTLGLVNVAFSPINAILASAATQPVVGYAASALQGLFAGIGAVGSEAADTGVDSLPVSQQTKDRIRPLAQELGALATQLVAGKAGADVVGKFRAKAADITEQVGKDVQVQLRVAAESEGATRIPIKTPNKVHAEYARSMGYEPYAPVDSLPIIKFGKRQKTTEPVIKAGAKPVEVLPAGARVVPEAVSRETPQSQPIEMLTLVPEATPILSRETALPRTAVASEPTIKPLEPVGTGETRTPQLAQSIEQSAVERRLLQSGITELPQYQGTSWAEQARLSQELLNRDPQAAVRVAMGRETPPQGILPEAVLNAVEERAIRTGDGPTLQRLAQESTLARESVAMGQRIGVLSQRENLSPIKALARISEGVREAFRKRTKKDYNESVKQETDSMKREMKKSAPKRQDWDSFIRDLTCGI